jgi:hypothetical protein
VKNDNYANDAGKGVQRTNEGQPGAVAAQHRLGMLDFSSATHPATQFSIL